MRYSKVIFCSRDCTYRAPVAAEILLKKLVGTTLDGLIAIEAKGMMVMFPEPVNGKAVAIGKSKGYNLDQYAACEIADTDFGIDTLVLVMTDKGKRRVYDVYASAINVYTIKEFVGLSGDIGIPFGMGLSDYGESFNQLEELVGQVANKLLSM